MIKRDWQRLFDGIRYRINSIERVRYAISDEEWQELERIWNEISKIDNDVQARC